MDKKQERMLLSKGKMRLGMVKRDEMEKGKELTSAQVIAVIGTFCMVLSAIGIAYGQNGNAGISKATSEVKGYFATGTSLMYAIGALSGLVGAVKVYNKWSAGEPDTAKVASSWFGACIFLVVVATVLKSFFGV